ncbi:GDSL-type esterase/lipase family protein [Tardiphaga sp. 285_C5_N1_2]|uniref:SGNH/GDSL hydrolase family protein n=1 Tax=Tardiphaga sp. 285_C5_N1_2 TaxID=3240775 RepID=UPI003F8ABE0E
MKKFAFASSLLAGMVTIAALVWHFDQTRQFSKRLDEQTEAIRDLRVQWQLSDPSNSDNRHSDIRIFGIKSNLLQTENQVLFIGDSITEAARLPLEICGHPIVNGGIGGASSFAYDRLVASMFEGRRFPLVVVAIGTNDSLVNSLPPPALSKSYVSLLDNISKLTSRVVVVGLPPIDTNRSLARFFSADLATSNNEIIRNIASQRNLPFVDLRGAMDGVKQSVTIDGVHLNAAGFKLWEQAVFPAVRQVACEAGSKPPG